MNNNIAVPQEAQGEPVKHTATLKYLFAFILAALLFSGGYILGVRASTSQAEQQTMTPTTPPTPAPTTYLPADHSGIITGTFVSHAPTGTFEDIWLNTYPAVSPNSVSLKAEGIGNGYKIENPVKDQVYTFKYTNLDPQRTYIINASACTGFSCAKVTIDACPRVLEQVVCTIKGSGNVVLSVPANARPVSPQSTLSVFPADPTPTPQ
jgi:hypothetical protein